jgi:reactive intermediate/imine deaminase
MTAGKVKQDSGPMTAGPHYSPFVAAGGSIFVSGQLPLLPGRDTSLADAPFAAQAEQAMRNLEAVLAETGTGLAQVVKTTVYLSNIDDWGQVGAIYARVFGASRPARSVVPTGPLHFGFRIEVEAIAVAV